MTTGTVNAGSGSKKKNTNAAADMVIRHMEQMKKKFPEFYEEARQTAKKLNNGKISPRKTCSNCHIEE